MFGPPQCNNSHYNNNYQKPYKPTQYMGGTFNLCSQISYFLYPCVSDVSGCSKTVFWTSRYMTPDRQVCQDHIANCMLHIMLAELQQ